LGLAIVELALRANGASLNLANRTDRLGLRAEIIWPARSGFQSIPTSASGSGLGLAIVELALRANGASLNLANRTDRLGLRAEIIWPARSGSFQSIPTGTSERERSRDIQLLPLRGFGAH